MYVKRTTAVRRKQSEQQLGRVYSTGGGRSDPPSAPRRAARPYAQAQRRSQTASFYRRGCRYTGALRAKCQRPHRTGQAAKRRCRTQRWKNQGHPRSARRVHRALRSLIARCTASHTGNLACTQNAQAVDYPRLNSTSGPTSSKRVDHSKKAFRRTAPRESSVVAMPKRYGQTLPVARALGRFLLSADKGLAFSRFTQPSNSTTL